ncbi:MAG: site-specific DNA-methyltransferase [Lachnospiraceae bacterium]|nr:site-specific DNA-methyltransferase [Lachnospiraceae bacterium]
MRNLSKIRRDKMIEFLNRIREEHKDDDETLIAINEIEHELNSKKYGLVWEEHEEEVDVMLQDNIPVFSEVSEREINAAPGENYNFLLEGDNLHSLKLLEKTHKGKIDVIYIDPPYNTKNKDFIYDDKMVGDDDAFKHSKWLSFMERRLRIANTLLAADGIIFISINDYEGAQIKLLCDEVFSENNFIGQLTWESTTQPTNAGAARFSLQKKVESIYCYGKNKAKREGFKLREIKNELKYPHNGKFGKCRFEIIEKSDAGAYKRDSMKYSILGQYPREGKRWQIGEEKARELEEKGKLEIVDGIVKRAIYPEDEEDKKTFEPFWSHYSAEQVGTAQKGKDELNEIMGYAVGFDTVKPVDLIKELLSHFDNSVVMLDFFAGSGTTAQAVLELNKEDGGNRKFILCTNNENNICEETTYQRIKTVITGKRQDDSEYSEGIPANLKYYRTGFVPKDEEFLSDALLEHIVELIQLKYGIKIDNQQYKILMSDEDADDLEKNWDKYPDIKKIFLASDILLTGRQEELFNGVDLYTVPDCFYGEELREVGELW